MIARRTRECRDVNPRTKGHRKFITRIVFALLIVGCAVVVWFALRPTDEESAATPSQRKTGSIKEVKPTAPAVKVKEDAPVAVDETETPRTQTYFDEQGIERYPGGARVPRKNPNKVSFPDRRAVKWTFDCEDEISALIDMEPGDVVVGDIEYGESFIVDFNNSLTNKIVVSAADDPYSRRLKEGVIAAKQDLYDAMQRGEDIAQIMTDTRREMRNLFEYKSLLEEEISAIRDSGEYTDENIYEFVEAANKMLEDKGIPPIKMPRMLINKFRRR